MNIKITDKTGSVIFLNKHLMPSQDYMVCSAVVHDSYDEKIEPLQKHNRLLEGLIKEGHFGVLDHAMPTFKIQCPIFVARQVMRASNASFNEISGRYKVLEGHFYFPEVYHTDVKRTELGEYPKTVNLDKQGEASQLQYDSVEQAWVTYTKLLEMGIRKEQARIHLPFNTMTEFWMSLKLSDWLHFLNLRTDTHAQAETKFIADLILEELREQFPLIIEYWEKYAKGPINDYGTIQTP